MPLFSKPPKNLCILRLSAIGDVCHALAMVQRIQRAWPETKISWIIGKTEAALFQNIDGIEWIIFDKKCGWRGIFALWKQLKTRQFDALLNLQTAIRASILSLGIHAHYKIGFGKQRSREMQWLFVNQRVTDPQTPHVLDGFMAFADFLGVPSAAPQWQLPTTQKDRIYASQFIDSKRKNLIIAPCSSKAEKDWLPERYASVANFANAQNINVIFCASPAPRELEMVNRIVAQCDFSPQNAAGKTSLGELTALIAQVDLVISPDSGTAHIATTQHTPVIGLYAYHNPKRTAPYCDQDKVISVYEQNLQREFNQPDENLPWATKLKGQNLMAQISVESVIEMIKKQALF